MIGWQARWSPTQKRYVGIDVATRQFIPRHVIFSPIKCQRRDEVTFADASLSTLANVSHALRRGGRPYANAKRWHQMLRCKIRFYIEQGYVQQGIASKHYGVSAARRMLCDCKTSTMAFKSLLISFSSHAQQREQPKTDPAKTDQR
jgi:hypothetical protein